MSDIPRRIGTSESRLDRAIDRAVRDMMQVDPRPGLRGRVLARLHREPARWAMVPRFAIVAVSVALLLFIVMVVVPDRRSEPPATAARHEAAPIPPTSRSGGVPPTAEDTSTTPRASTRPIQRQKPRFTNEPITIPRVANVFGSQSAGAAAASVSGEAVWPTPAPAPAPQDDHGIGLPPLTIPSVPPPAPIVIPPIGPRGPGLND